MTTDPAEIARRRADAQDWYGRNAEKYSEFAREVARVMRFNLAAQSVVVQSVSHRVKSVESLVEKCLRPDKDDPMRFKYTEPLTQITDVAGIRVVTYLQDSIAQVERVLRETLTSAGPEQRVGADDPAVPGYRGVHYLVEMTSGRLDLPEYEHFRGLRAELQVQTVLQHAWAEIQHDILYKGQARPPVEVRRRLVALAGLLELADAEFRDVANQLEEAQEATAVEAAAQEADQEADTDALDAVTLRALLSEHLQVVVGVVWLDQLLGVLTELGIGSVSEAEAVAKRWSYAAEPLRAHLSRTGYVPGATELFDAMLRLDLGERYLNGREAFRSAPAAVQERARAALEQLQSVAAEVPR